MKRAARVGACVSALVALIAITYDAACVRPAVERAFASDAARAKAMKTLGLVTAANERRDARDAARVRVEARRAFRRKALEHHPDKRARGTSAREFVDLVRALETLAPRTRGEGERERAGEHCATAVAKTATRMRSVIIERLRDARRVGKWMGSMGRRSARVDAGTPELESPRHDDRDDDDDDDASVDLESFWNRAKLLLDDDLDDDLDVDVDVDDAEDDDSPYPRATAL